MEKFYLFSLDRRRLGDTSSVFQHLKGTNMEGKRYYYHKDAE